MPEDAILDFHRCRIQVNNWFPRFKGQIDSLIRVNASGWSQCSLTIPKILGPLRITLNWFSLSSLNGSTKPEWQHICWKPWFTEYFKSTGNLLLRKKVPLIWMFIKNAPDHPKILMEMYNENNYGFMLANTTSILQPWVKE